jgi:hypothetical protein
MLDGKKVLEIERLLGEGFNEYQIAKKTKISERSVRRIRAIQEEARQIDQYYAQQQQQPQQQIQQQPLYTKPIDVGLDKESRQIINKLDRYDQTHNIPSQSEEAKFAEEERLLQWQEEKKEKLQKHEQRMEKLRDLEIRQLQAKNSA